jgi:hypothetical protein
MHILPYVLKEGQHVDDVSACLSIQITFKLLHAPQQGEIYVQLYILYDRGIHICIIKCAMCMLLTKKNNLCTSEHIYINHLRKNTGVINL